MVSRRKDDPLTSIGMPVASWVNGGVARSSVISGRPSVNSKTTRSESGCLPIRTSVMLASGAVASSTIGRSQLKEPRSADGIGSTLADAGAVADGGADAGTEADAEGAEESTGAMLDGGVPASTH